MGWDGLPAASGRSMVWVARSCHKESREESGDAMRSRFGMIPGMRIRSEADFKRIYRRGSRARGKILLVVACENELGRTRLGLSVGRKIWKLAVRRNRLRRIFREAFRLTYPELPQGVDLILIPAEPRLDPTLEETRRELVYLAGKAHRRHLERRASEEAAAAEGREGPT